MNSDYLPNVNNLRNIEEKLEDAGNDLNSKKINKILTVYSVELLQIVCT